MDLVATGRNGETQSWSCAGEAKGQCWMGRAGLEDWSCVSCTMSFQSIDVVGKLEGLFFVFQSGFLAFVAFVAVVTFSVFVAFVTFVFFSGFYWLFFCLSGFCCFRGFCDFCLLGFLASCFFFLHLLFLLLVLLAFVRFCDFLAVCCSYREKYIS